MYNPQSNKVKRDAMKKNKQKEKKRKRNLEGNDSDSGAAEKDGEDMDEDQNFGTLTFPAYMQPQLRSHSLSLRFRC
jgi:hypothetical protein